MKLIVIGGVAAGMSAASKAKRSDPSAEVIVYEKGSDLSYGACGLPYYVGDFITDSKKLIARTKEDFEAAGIGVFLQHEAVAVDPKQKTVTIKNRNTGELETQSYDKLMIATGASAVIPPFKGREKDNIFVLKTLTDGIALKKVVLDSSVKNITVVGGGFIGLECVDAFLHLGKQVRVIEAAERLILPFDKEMSEQAFNELEAKGVHLHLNEKVTAFTGDKKVETVTTDKGTYETDLVVIAVGVRPDTTFLEDTTIALAKNGAIVVNQQMQTTEPDVYAAGDCAECFHFLTNKNTYLALGTNANKCGRIAGTNMLGGTQIFQGALASSAIKVCDIELVRTGLGEEDAKNSGFNCKTVLVTTKDRSGYYPGATMLYTKLVYEVPSMRILGAQLCGKSGAVLRGNIFATAIQAGMTTQELGMTDLAYAPPFSGVWDTVHIACNAAK